MFIAEAEGYFDILLSPAHLGAEFTIELVTAALGFVVGRRPWRKWHEKHDRGVHGHE